MRVFRKLSSIRVCAAFPFGFEGGNWDWNGLIPNKCLSIYLVHTFFTDLCPYVFIIIEYLSAS